MGTDRCLLRVALLQLTLCDEQACPMPTAQGVDAPAREGAQEGLAIESEGHEPLTVKATRLLVLERAKQLLLVGAREQTRLCNA